MTDIDELLSSYEPLDGIRLNASLTAYGDWKKSTSEERDRRNSADLRLLNHLRSISDLIITTSKTVVAENYRPSKWTPIAVLSRSNAVLNHQLFNSIDTPHEPFLITDSSQEAKGYKVLRFVNLEKPEPLINLLSNLGYERILLETGPTTTKWFEPLISELCLTIHRSSFETNLIRKISQQPFVVEAEYTYEDQHFVRLARN